MIFKGAIRTRIPPGTAILGFTIAVKLLALLREVLIARTLGAGPAADALAIGQSLPNFLSNALLGPLSSSLLPTIARIWSSEGLNGGQRVLQTATVVAGLVTAAAAAIIVAIQSALIEAVAPGIDPSTKLEAQSIQNIFALNIVVTALSTTLTIGSFAAGSYLVPTARSCISPIATILVLMSSARETSPQRIAVAILLANIAETILLALHLRTIGYRLTTTLVDTGIHTKTVLNQYLPILAGAAILNFGTLAETHIASRLGPGTLALLSYGTRIISAASSLVTAGLSNMLLADLSHKAGKRDFQNLAATTRFASIAAGSITLAISIVIALFSTQITGLLFHKSQLTHDERVSIAYIQAIFAWQMPFYVVSTILARGISSLKGNHLLTLTSLQSTAIQTTINAAISSTVGVYCFPATSAFTYAMATVTNALTFRHLLRRSRSHHAL